jgi:predicted acyltransferase
MVELPQSVTPPAALRTHRRVGRGSASDPHDLHAPHTPHAWPRRVVFVDGLRLVAALQMVQGHTLDALLAEDLRHGLAFRVWTFVRGLTSPAFLLSAGLAFALATATPLGLAEGRSRRLLRAIQLLVLGYLMHAPLGILLGDPWREAARQALLVDVLQCIGVCLLLLELGCGWLRGRAGRAWLGAGLGSLCFALGPWSERIVPSGLWWPALNYLSAQRGSLFPLLPWAGFVFWGLALGQALPARADEPGRGHAPLHGLGATHMRGLRPRLARRLAGAGLSSCALAGVLFAVLPSYAARVSPAYALLKLGLVLLVAGALAAWLEGRSLPALLRRLSSETLFLYVSHVLLLYAGHVGLAQRVGRTQSLAWALLGTLCLLLACAAGALGYRRVQQALRGEGARGTPRAQPTSFPG